MEKQIQSVLYVRESLTASIKPIELVEHPEDIID